MLEKKNRGSCKNCQKPKKQKKKNKLIVIKLKKKLKKTTENKKENLDVTYCIREAQYHCYNL